jgi:hypothetical protein
MNMIHIKIGNQDEAPVAFYVRHTKAPPTYDGFGTITLARWTGDDGTTGERFVLIRDTSLKWQEGRYASGMYGCTEPEHGAITEESVAEELWKRLATERTQDGSGQ